jgi:AdoMet-dependent rRNA methyltransferase SPB1
LKLAAKKLKKKQHERKAKHLLKLRLGMGTPMEIGLEASTGNMSDLEYDFGTGVDKIESGKEDSESDSELEYDSDAEIKKRIHSLDDEMEGLFNDYLSRKTKKEAALVVKKQKEGAAEFEEWYGVEYDKNLEQDQDMNDSDSDSSFSSLEDQENEPLSKKAKIFFDNPLFKSVTTTNESSMFDKEMNDSLSDSSDEEINVKEMKKKRKRRSEKEDKKDFEVIPLEKDADEEDDQDYVIKTAQEYTMAQQLVRPSGKRDLMDSSYNRYAFNDPDLPLWFEADENRHNKPSMPVTKEAVAILKQKAMAMDARPIRKVAEAKFRKKVRAERQIEKMLKKAAVINEDEDQSEKSKLSKISELVKKAKGKGQVKDRPKLVIARGGNKKTKGRPKGVKGRYKMVDSRMKKDLMHDKKNNQKKSKGRKK